jgi:hypothetical protein
MVAPLSSIDTLLNTVPFGPMTAVAVSSEKVKVTGEGLSADISVSWKLYTVADAARGKRVIEAAVSSIRKRPTVLLLSCSFGS